MILFDVIIGVALGVAILLGVYGFVFACQKLAYRGAAKTKPTREDYIESNRLLNELCEKRSQVIGKLQIERDNFWKACEMVRQEALATEARKDEQIASLQAQLKERKPSQPKKSAPKIRKGAKKK